MPGWFDETDAEDLIICFAVEGVVTRERTDFQDLAIFDSPGFGRVLALDGIVQLTEADECVYHEMIAHVPLLAHGRARRVLVIGGGDGGTVREVLKHDVDEVVTVELDRQVVEACREHLPSVNDGAFEDPRLELCFEDGVNYVANCERILTTDGILISQFGMPFLYPDAVRDALRRLALAFEDATFYIVAVPVFAGGYMAFGWACDSRSLREPPVESLAERLSLAGIETRFYTPAFHRAAFVLPRQIAALLD
jgi:spermidine synthase